MNKVVTINLGGRAYQLEEAGFDALRAYLDDAQARLSNDPGKDEIVADLEQAIAEKCDKVLSPHKSVVLSSEVARIIDEMGPVEGEGKSESAGAKEGASKSGSTPRRFYLSREGAVFAGVCAGLAQYFDIDETIVRIIFIALTVFTGGFWILVYLALAVLVPYADTAEAKAQARGEPFNAEALVQRAKERWGESYERVTGNKWDDMVHGMTSAHAEHLKWKLEKKLQRKEWKRQWKAHRYAHRHPNPVIGFFLGVTGLLWVLALISLISTGAIFGWVVPAGIPLWLSIVLLFVLYQALTGPLRGGGYGYWDGGQYHYEYRNDPWEGFLGVLTFIFLCIAFVWAYRDVPQFYFFVHHPIAGTQELIAYLGSLFH